jgi:hypothetical protein
MEGFELRNAQLIIKSVQTSKWFDRRYVGATERNAAASKDEESRPRSICADRKCLRRKSSSRAAPPRNESGDDAFVLSLSLSVANLRRFFDVVRGAEKTQKATISAATLLSLLDSSSSAIENVNGAKAESGFGKITL